MTARRYLRITLIGLVVAMLFGLLTAGQLVLATMTDSQGYTFGHAVIMQTPLWVFWAPIFPLILWLVHRYPLERGSFRDNLPIHLAAAIVISLFHFGFRLWFMHVIGHGYPRGHSYWVHFGQAATYRLWVHLFGYLVLLGIALASDYYRKYRDRQLLASQLAAQLSQARLQALRMQLNPHFLFNALNSIAMLVRKQENTSAVRMVAGLADLLRYVLEDSPRDEVLLREELDFIKRYLEIERVRFNDGLRVNHEIDERALDAFIPSLLLQPVVENAIVHGLARKTGAGQLDIRATIAGDRLLLEITDDGVGLNGAGPTRGVGIANSRKRLEQLYGDQFSFDIRNRQPAGVAVTISLPFHTQPVTTAVSAA